MDKPESDSGLKRFSSDLGGPPSKRPREAILELVPDDLDASTHERMDQKILGLEDPNNSLSAASCIVTEIFYQSRGLLDLDEKYQSPSIVGNLLIEHPELMKKIREAWSTRSFREIRNLKILRPQKPTQAKFQGDYHLTIVKNLAQAYGSQFVGNTPINFLNHLEKLDFEDKLEGNRPFYGKAISVVQSSGTGKSRMLTEVGKLTFTLPICLRRPKAPGYPLCDISVFKYIKPVAKESNDLSKTVHLRFACFLGALHQTMLESLQLLHDGARLDGKALLEAWYGHMEQYSEGRYRIDFFSKVVARARKAFAKIGWTRGDSPIRANEEDNSVSLDFANECYNTYVKKPTEDLMQFIKTLDPSKDPLCVTYFDEAQEMETSFWILMRLLQAQASSTKMWYVFMGTKSSISYYAPSPKDLHSLKLRQELSRLVPPYIALDFDQHAISQDRTVVNFRMGNFESLDHIALYGRPLWHAQMQATERSPLPLLEFAASKLLNFETFDPTSKEHVFALLSQRLCLDTVLATTEAMELADRSVAHHMRLLTGFSTNFSMFFTHSPSEPFLVLGAIRILYSKKDPKILGRMLETLSNDLCSAGCIDKGHLGELCARILLMAARDYTVQEMKNAEHFLKPVRLLDVINNLFGNAGWGGSDKEKFNTAFANAYVNFTHWVVTKYPLPEDPSRMLLANLWARNTILQCCHRQESLDFLGVAYFGSVAADAIFDPDLLSGFVIQVKHKEDADTKAESNLRPIAIPRDLNHPLPYLALLMELGTESSHQSTGSKVKAVASEVPHDGGFQKLTEEWLDAKKRYDKCPDKTDSKRELKEVVDKKRLAMDRYNRYSISVRGASPDVYGILVKAQIVKSFATLLNTITPSPTPEDVAIQHMRPFEHAAWMFKYTKSNDGE